MLVTCFSMGQAPELPQAGGHALAVPAGGGRSQHQGAGQSAHGAAGDRGDLVTISYVATDIKFNRG